MPYTGSQLDEDKVSPTSDFRSRYPAETAGMPSNLATIAARNLAAEDASIAKFNAVSRLLPSPPSPTPLASDESRRSFSAGGPATSLADLHTDDIAQRRDALESRKKLVMAHLGLIDPREAGLAGVVVPGHDRYGLAKRHEMLQELDALEGQSRDLMQEHHYNTIAAARDAHENFARQTHINAANDFSSLATELADLHKNAKPGTPEFANGVLNIATRHPAGFQTQAGQSLIRTSSDLHDKSATLEDRSYWQRFGQAHNEASQIGRRFGVDVQYDDQGFPSVEATTKYGQENGTITAADKPPPAAYVKQAAALAEAKAKKDKDYNANPKADLTKRDQDIAIEEAKLSAMKEALGMAEPPVAAGVSPANPATATPPPPNITPEAHAALKPGEKFWWNGQQLTKK